MGDRLSRASLRRTFMTALEASPGLYCRYQTRFPDRHPVTADTDIVIEGYPSAANSFTREAFLYANPNAKVASHLHSLAPLRLAVERGLPAVVLLRLPLDSVVSLLLRFDMSDAQAEYRRYIRFYEGLESLRDGVLFVRFEEASSDLGAVIQRVNDRFGTNFSPFGGSEEALRVVHGVIDTYSRSVFGADAASKGAHPSAERAERARLLRPEVIARVPPAEQARADRLYEKAVEWAREQGGIASGPRDPASA